MSELIGNWDKIASLFNSSALNSFLHKAAERVGNEGRSMVIQGIKSGAPGGMPFKPLSPVTIANKGSSKPLINHGDLIGSVTYEVLDNNHVFIGVKKGQEANIAAVHEFGCTIRVTQKMRAYLHHNGIHLKTSTQYIHIPARPFLRPVLLGDEFKNVITNVYLEALKKVFLS